MNMLEDPRYTVVSVPAATSGVAWLRAHVPRFSEGDEHGRLRRKVDELLGGINPEALRRPGAPVANLAAALGLPRDAALVADVAEVARSYQPHAPQTNAADAAVARLVERCGGRWDDEVATRIGVLVQTCDAARAMIAGTCPPVAHTRRISPAGDEVLVDLTDAPFGAGHHACPGRSHALALVDGALAFTRLHHGPAPLVLPNAWDHASALALVAAGFPAIGTTSLGVAATYGLPDAAGATRLETLALARRLGRLPVPVTIDVEAGFDDVPADLAAELSAWGVAGVNVEDGRGDTLADPAVHAAIVAGFKRGAPELFVNARVDTYWLGISHSETLERAQRYVDAGADGIFVPGLSNPATIAHLAAALPVPLNVFALLPVPRLTELGVRRVSTGSLLFRIALAAAISAAQRVRDADHVTCDVTYTDIEQLIATT